MPFKIATWNINSVRLRINLVQIPQELPARRAVLAGNQMPGRRLSAQTLSAARLRLFRAQRTEGLSRRRGALARAVRALRRTFVLRQDRLPPHLRCAGRKGGLKRPADG